MVRASSFLLSSSLFDMKFSIMYSDIPGADASPGLSMDATFMKPGTVFASSMMKSELVLALLIPAKVLIILFIT